MTTNPTSPGYLEATIRIEQRNHEGGIYRIELVQRAEDGKSEQSTSTGQVDIHTIFNFLRTTLGILEKDLPF